MINVVCVLPIHDIWFLSILIIESACCNCGITTALKPNANPVLIVPKFAINAATTCRIAFPLCVECTLDVLAGPVDGVVVWPSNCIWTMSCRSCVELLETFPFETMIGFMWFELTSVCVSILLLCICIFCVRLWISEEKGINQMLNYQLSKCLRIKIGKI